MRQLRVIALLLPVAVLVAGASGCAGRAGVGATESGLSFVQYKCAEAGVGDSALLSGVVEDADGCLTVEDSESEALYTPIFPTSTAIAVTLSAGDKVELRGGALDDLPENVDLPDGCSAEGPFWLVVADV